MSDGATPKWPFAVAAFGVVMALIGLVLFLKRPQTVSTTTPTTTTVQATSTSLLPTTEASVVPTSTEASSSTSSTNAHGSTTTVASDSARTSADRLLVDWAKANWADAAKYATPALVSRLKSAKPLAGQKTVDEQGAAGSTYVNIACGATKGKGAMWFRFSNVDHPFIANDFSPC